ncbi:unnamed protein product [Mytilus coruscus]|uniref:Uncharacterized protein n=1 Tax=Mytilus coruscus TaxID=42192 RepID=A0A6J8EKR3_MYTCO|nr:unnamed protein product [Mytilus coruscus]
MIETASVISFFGFLRCGDITVIKSEHFEPAINLCISDISFTDNVANLHLKQSKTDPFRKGYKYVVSGNINGKPCDLERFQPFKFKTEGNSRCVFEKSVCNEEGQVNLKNGTTISDRTCRCDYTDGYAFVTTPANICYCVPSQEDCSCFKKPCKEKEILTPGM